ncbi:MAG: response regulator [Lachnospiraceae bacterium]|nr:response regulator [Lachnospiraceae bacterium]
MYKVLIADDELIIRQGLRYILDWNELGYEIIGEEANGSDALHSIMTQKPDLVLLDIRMPQMLGIDVVKHARDQGYQGKFIILSGFTDFEYAQAAIRYGVDYYLTKPIDEDELLRTVQEISSSLSQEKEQEEVLGQYRDKAKGMILYDIIMNQADYAGMDYSDLFPQADQYQVVVCEHYSQDDSQPVYHFADLLKTTSEDQDAYDSMQLEDNEIILLRGSQILHRFQQFLEHYDREQKPQTNSPLDSLFITYGRVVDSIENVHLSYQEALLLQKRRFFCEYHQHTIGYDQLPEEHGAESDVLGEDNLNQYCELLSGYIQAAKRNQVAETLKDLENQLYQSEADIMKIKLFLTDLYLSIKERLSHLYHNANIPFPGNSEIIDYIGNRYYLYEIILYFSEQFEMIMRTIGNPSSDSVMDDIIHYIEHNYMNNIKLENIAPLFGYNSSYLGKIFTKKVGEGFNVFIDKVRIKHSKELLVETDLKVYEISEKVGYRNVDYFHTKFKKYVDQSPAEYRKQHKVK